MQDDDPAGPFRPDFGARRRPGPGPGRARPVRSAGAGTGGPSRRLWVLGGILLVILLFGAGLIEFWTDAIWYRSVGFDAVFWTRIGAGLALFVAGVVLSLVVLVGNLWLARRLAPPPNGVPGTFRDLFERLNEAGLTGSREDGFDSRPPRPVTVGPESIPDLTPTATLVLVGLSIFAALIIGASMAGAWQTVLLWINRVPFAAAGATTSVDPIFGRDISWFLFDLPFLRTIQSVFNGLVLGGLIVAFGRYLAGAPQSGLSFPTPVRVHLAVLAGLYLLSVAFGYQLDKYELVYSGRGAGGIIGVSFTDQNAQFFAYDLLTVLSAFAAAFLIGGAFTRWTWPLGATVVAWVLASLVVGRIYPEVVQRLTVDPNRLQQEQPYIANNIAMTREAFSLAGWEERQYSGDKVLTKDQIAAEAATFANARLWDYRPLGDTLDQLQTVRRYYDFTDVDTDRYTINGAERQVMLSARELNIAANDQATGWVNQRIIYTHGIGVAMVPVNEVTTEGQPLLYIKNLPPVSTGGAPTITEPRIYFGEAKSDYVVVRARQDEFDYPRGEGDGGGDTQVRTRWTGKTGIGLDTTLSRLLFALRFRDLDLLISDQVTADSEVLMYRTLSERLALIAPFLAYDKDPYVVITDAGRLVYVQDAFTTSNRFPNAQGIDPTSIGATGLRTGPINYIRNSVKVVMDAYDGTMTFYVSDPSDPIIQAYQGIFPTLFRPLAEMPGDIRAHLRVPEDLFNVQTAVFGRYHVTNPEVFFSGQDLWTVPGDAKNDQSLPSEAYYVIMRMPGEPDPEFLLLQPMVPQGRPNMIAWVAARNDGAKYGAVRVYRFPTDTSVFGPTQIEARIDQDPTISAQVTLWNQSGSKVVRGNLIVVPVGDTLIYLQPVYLQSTSSSFPEFQRIVVASPTSVVWGRTLAEALDLLLQTGGGPGPSPSPTPGGTPGPTASPGTTPVPTVGPGLPSDVAALIAYANTHFEAAQAALRNGDFAAYGREIELVRQALSRLDELAGATASPAP
ncbi:MAG: UPF0182 family protein [Chloroflexi bacterium]|nr:UPF0182 family protein [Chloroflexota bacterium]